MKKFWKWIRDQAESPEIEERTLFLNGTIAEESWFDDDVTPALFKSDLDSGSGNITVWINSPGGDCFAAAQIYNMLCDYKGRVTVKIDGIAASAASVIAMAGDEVLVSPVSMIMIHNPATIAMGDHNDMTKAIEMLESVKDSIINAYRAKTGLSRNKLSQLMEDETWMDSGKAVELGFADRVMERAVLSKDKPEEEDPDEDDPNKPEEPEEKPDEEEEEKKQKTNMLFSRRAYQRAVTNKLAERFKETVTEPVNERRVEDLEGRLELIKQYF